VSILSPSHRTSPGTLAGNPALAFGNDMDATLVSLERHQSESHVVRGRTPGRGRCHQGTGCTTYPAPRVEPHIRR